MRQTGSFCRSHVWARVLTACVAFAAVAFTTTMSLADEDGVSFWIPGFFGSLAAAPQQPGWSLTSILYNTNVSASGNAAVAREITIGRFNPTINISVSANVHADATIGFLAPSYTFATPFLGGQASAFLLFGYGNNDTSLNASATATIDNPPLSITRSVALQQDTTVGNGSGRGAKSRRSTGQGRHQLQVRERHFRCGRRDKPRLFSRPFGR